MLYRLSYLATAPRSLHAATGRENTRAPPPGQSKKTGGARRVASHPATSSRGAGAYFAAARAAWISASFALSARGMRGAFASSSVESFEGFFSYSA